MLHSLSQKAQNFLFLNKIENSNSLDKLLEQFASLPWPPEAITTSRIDSADPFTIIANEIQLSQMFIAHQFEAFANQYPGSFADLFLTDSQNISEVFDNAAEKLDTYSAMSRNAWLSNQFYSNPTTADSTAEPVESAEQLVNA